MDNSLYRCGEEVLRTLSTRPRTRGGDGVLLGEEYWTVEDRMATAGGARFAARVCRLNAVPATRPSASQSFVQVALTWWVGRCEKAASVKDGPLHRLNSPDGKDEATRFRESSPPADKSRSRWP